MSNIKSSHKECEVKIPYPEYAEIIRGFMKFIMRAVFNGETVELPARMGYISIKGKKVIPRFDENGEIVNLAPDWVKTGKLWKENPEAEKERRMIYHFNEHTAGVRYKITWDRSTTGAVNKMLYLFIPSRENKRTAWKSVLAGKEYYVKPRYHANT